MFLNYYYRIVATTLSVNTMFSKNPAFILVGMIVVTGDEVQDVTPSVCLRLSHETVDLSGIPIACRAVSHVYKSLVMCGQSVSAIPSHLPHH
jgi:hypothetical protein